MQAILGAESVQGVWHLKKDNPTAFVFIRQPNYVGEINKGCKLYDGAACH
jgi:hypothetical protein